MRAKLKATWEQEAREILEPAGWRVSLYAPGDGVTRYRFIPPGDGPSYFSSSRGVTVLGRGAANDWMSGFVHGLGAGRSEKGGGE